MNLFKSITITELPTQHCLQCTVFFMQVLNILQQKRVIGLDSHHIRNYDLLYSTVKLQKCLMIIQYITQNQDAKGEKKKLKLIHNLTTHFMKLPTT